MTTPTTETTKAPRALSLVEQLDKLIGAFNTFAPGAVLGNKTRGEFQNDTDPSRTARADLARLTTTVKGGISNRNNADKITQALIKRVIAGVLGDPAHGPDSGLYRAMGFIPLSERKRPLPAGTGEKSPKSATKPIMERFETIASAWQEIAPGTSFSGMTLEEFRAGAAASIAAREALNAARVNHKVGIVARNDADRATRASITRLVASVVSDPAYGNDCALYRAMGYIPASERRTVKRQAPSVPAAPATPAV